MERVKLRKGTPKQLAYWASLVGRPRTPAQLTADANLRGVPNPAVSKALTGRARPDVSIALKGRPKNPATQAYKKQPHTEEANEKNRLSHLGVPQPPGHGASVSKAQTGVPKPRVSEAMTGIPASESDYINQRGGFYDRQHKELVLERDGHICQICGITEADYKAQQTGKLIFGLSVHHIKDWDNYPKLRFVVENGVSLCNPCHKREHASIVTNMHKFKNLL